MASGSELAFYWEQLGILKVSALLTTWRNSAQQIRQSARFERSKLTQPLQARRKGKRLFYDPEIEVLHHVAPRLGTDQIHRGRFSYDATVDLAFNETFVILKHASGLFRLTALLWQLLVGSPQCPGIAILVRSAVASKPIGFLKIRATLKGRFLAWLVSVKSLLDQKLGPSIDDLSKKEPAQK